MYNILKKLLIWILVVLVAWPGYLYAQDTGTVFKPEEIEQLVAPIALYPDSLVSQILMASTYPLEVVQADRWLRANKTLKGDALTAALETQTWDPSVKSLVNFPQVLDMMNQKLDLTQRLGDAFLAQQKDVLDAVQRLRARAQAQGTLQTTKEQTVIVEQPEAQTTVIRIEPADPQVVYVPTYNPTVVYGAWPYPAYPPYAYYPPGYGVAAAAFSFTAGVALGAAWGYAWGGCNWHGGDVDIDINRNTNINRNINRESYRANMERRGQSGGRGNWQHDASHRKGVAYRDQGTAQRFNKGRNQQAVASREAFRGRAESGRQELGRGGADRIGQGGTRDRVGGGGDRIGQGGTRDRVGAGSHAGSIGDRGGRSSRESGLGDRPAQRSGSSARTSDFRSTSRGREADAFKGVGRGSEVRSASSRGAASRGGHTRSAGGGGHRGGGGGHRGGGGGHGGGGGGRR
jgi:hypothetical protein